MAFYAHDFVDDSPINNFATLNSIHHDLVNETMRNGNLYYEAGAYSYSGHGDMPICFGNIPAVEGHNWYWECHISSTLSNNRVAGGVGILNSIRRGKGNFGYSGEDYYNGGSYGWTIDSNSANWNNGWNYSVNGTTTSSIQGVSYFKHNDIVGVHLDLVANKVYLYVNGIPFNAGSQAGRNGEYSIISSKTWFPVFACGTSGGAQHFRVNFGQDHTFGGASNLPAGAGAFTPDNQIGSFAFQPPAGALALCTANIPEGYIKLSQDQTPSDHFKAVTYTGSIGNDQLVDCGFPADFIWIKGRTAPFNTAHMLYDTVRGRTSVLSSNNTDGEFDYGNLAPTFSTASNSINGFKTPPVTNNNINDSGSTYVAWCWKAAGSPDQDYASANDGSAKIINENGSANTLIQDCAALATAATNAGASNVITPSKVSANRQNGFSIVRYTGNGTNGATIPHGLGKKPKLIIEKAYSGASNYYNWSVQGCGELWTPATSNLFLNTSQSLNPSGAYGAPDSNTFYPSKVAYANENNVENIAYIFTDIEGYSKCGSYTANGSTTGDGPYVHCGFRPAFVMVKNISEDDQNCNWSIFDTARQPFNVSPANNRLEADTTNAEDGDGRTGVGNGIDFLSNGFKLRAGNWYETNHNSDKYIFMAFAEQPFSGPSNAR